LNAISLRGIQKTYPAHRGKTAVHALKGIDLEVESGMIYCVLGPNGAGKTTLIAILTTLLYPDGGDGTIFGLDLQKERGGIRRIVNVTSGNPNFTDVFTVRENLNYYGMLYGLPKAVRNERIGSLIETFELKPYEHVLFNRLSSGLRQRLALAKAMLNDPKVLFLDEPTVGLDPKISETVRRTLKQISREKGLTLILTTHQMREAEFLSDRIAFLREGRIVAEGNPGDLKRGIRYGEKIRILYDGPVLFSEEFSGLEGVLGTEGDDHLVTVTVDDHAKRLDPIIRRLSSDSRRVIRNIDIVTPDLEDVFLELAGSSH
jgi:ABC-2 type transport system ATP-binding protein